MYDHDKHSAAWLEEVRRYISRADLNAVTAPVAAEHFQLCTTAFYYRLRRMGHTFHRLKHAERERRLREALDDAPTSEPEFLTELCGFRSPKYFELFFINTIGCRVNEFRARHGLRPLKCPDR